MNLKRSALAIFPCRGVGSRASRSGGAGRPRQLGRGKGSGRYGSGSEEGALVRRALPHHVRHVDPGAGAVRACAPSSGGLHRGLGERQQDLPRSAARAAAHHREHRNGSRDRPDHEAAVRGAVDRLRDGEASRVHVHPRRHPLHARDRHFAARGCGRVRRRRSRTRSRRSRTGHSCWGRAGWSAGGTG